MRFSKILKLSLLVILAVSIVGCSATPTRRSFKEGWKDSVVSTKVKYKLAKDKLVKKRNIDVDAWRGVVTLTGRVTSLEEKERAEQLAWQVKGVRGVDNFLKLVGNPYYGTGEAVAEGGIAESDLNEVAERDSGTGTKATTSVAENPTPPTKKVAARKPASHPLKTKESRVSRKVEGPVVYEEETKTKEKFTAKRGGYTDTNPTEIEEKSLTNEESLAIEAAEELRRLRGE